MDGCKNITTILNPSCVDSKDIGKNFTAQYRKKKNGIPCDIFKRRKKIYEFTGANIFFNFA